MSRARALATIAAILAASPRIAAAADDGVYGRLDGDLEVRAEAGAAFAEGGPALAAGAALLYLGTAGVYGHYTDALGSERPRVTRSIATGLHVQPLFLARLAIDREHGPAYLDLFLDSFALEIGAVWDATREGRGPAHLRASPGFEVALGLAFPIIPRATGAYLGVRGALRWRSNDLDGPRRDAIERGGVLSLTLAWHHVVRSHLVDPGDGLSR